MGSIVSAFMRCEISRKARKERARMPIMASKTQIYSDFMGSTLGRSGKDISDPPYRANQAMAVFQFFAQVTDMDVEEAVIRSRFAFEEGGRDLFAGHNPSCCAHQHLQ